MVYLSVSEQNMQEAVPVIVILSNLDSGIGQNKLQASLKSVMCSQLTRELIHASYFQVILVHQVWLDGFMIGVVCSRRDSHSFYSWVMFVFLSVMFPVLFCPGISNCAFVWYWTDCSYQKQMYTRLFNLSSNYFIKTKVCKWVTTSTEWTYEQ